MALTVILCICGWILFFTMLWYIRLLFKKLVIVSQDFQNLIRDVEEYATHLDVVYNADVFFGDPTLENLLKHTKDINKRLKESKRLFMSVGPDEEYEKTDDNPENQDENNDAKI